jgi:hypothetical protein
MKKVIKTDDNNIVNIEKINTTKYYGVYFGPNNRGFITNERYRGMNYTVRSIEGLTYANGYSNYNYSTLPQLVDTIISQGDIVYEFDTPEELFTWLMEK